MWLVIGLGMASFLVFLAVGRGKQASTAARAPTIDENSQKAAHRATSAEQQARRHNAAGIALGRDGDHAGAIREFRTAISLRPTDAEGYYNLGVVLGNTGNHTEALANFRTAVRLNPNDAEAHSNLGMMFVAHDNLWSALREFEATLRLAPNRREARGRRMT